MKYRAWSVFLLASSVVVLGAGCNPFQAAQEKVEQKIAESVTEKAIETATGGKVDVDMEGDDGVVMRDNKTGGLIAFGENIKIPDDFPKVIPRYDGAKASSFSIGGTESKGATMGLATSDSVVMVVSWYDAKLKSEGWTEGQSFTAKDSETRIYEKGDESLTLSITRPADGDGKTETVIYIVYSVKEES